MPRRSQAQHEANRNNAKHSRGPLSPDGKHRSSQNAIRHGLTGRVVVLPTEDMEAYRKFSNELVDSLHPETPMEIQFAQTVADAQWRLNRARTIEDGMLAMGHFEAAGNFHAADPNIHAALTAAKVFREHSKDFANLTLYEQRIQRAQKEALRQLRDSQAERKAAPPAAKDETPATVPLVHAAAAIAAPEHSNRTPHTVVNRFVYSSVETAPPASRDTLPATPETHPANLEKRAA